MSIHEEKIRDILQTDGRYDKGAYLFVLEALTHTVEMLGRKDLPDQERHVSGRELLDGIRKFALRCFGPLARIVLNRWGIRRTEDLGDIVFKLVEVKLLLDRPSDSRDDFSNGFDFHVTFEKTYAVELPESIR